MATTREILNKLAQYGAYKLKKAGITFVGELLTITDKGLAADAELLRWAEWFTMKPNGRASEYLQHFLDGTGTPVTFSLRDLMLEDGNVRARIENEILRKVSGIKVAAERRLNMSYDPSVTLFQSTYASPDWWYALGTFNVQWKVIQSTPRWHFIEVSGSNLYRWYPDEKRITQSVHQAADRLIRAGRGKAFSIVAQPHVLALSEEQRKMVVDIVHLTDSAFKPTSDHASIQMEGVMARIKGLF